MPRLRVAVALSACAFVWAGAAHAQFGRGGGDWTNDGGDAQRSGWVRSDPKISVESVSKPGFAVIWKIPLGHEPGRAATLDRYIGYRGFRSYAFLGSPSGDLTAIDSDLGRVEWKRSLATSAASANSAACPGGMTASVVRPTGVGYPSGGGGRGGGGGGRSQAAKSAVGQPGEGAVTISEIAARAAAAAAAANRGPGRGPAGGAGIFGRNVQLLDVLSTDGMLHSMYVSNGEEPKPPLAFVPANANAHGLIVVENVAYAATSGGCGGAPNAIWALDLTSKEVVHWTPSGDVTGFAFGPDSTVYAATSGGELVALEAKTLQVKGTYRSGGAVFTSSPLVFEHKDKNIIAAATKDGHVHLVDAASMAGASYPAALTGELASWQDGAGNRWLLGPSKDSIAAWKVGSAGDMPALQPGWTSRAISSPLTPIVVNGVVFAVANGSSAMLYALDGSSGKELWNSGKAIPAPVRHSGLSGSGSQLYLGASDRTIYAFGFPIEH